MVFRYASRFVIWSAPSAEEAVAERPGCGVYPDACREAQRTCSLVKPLACPCSGFFCYPKKSYSDSCRDASLSRGFSGCPVL